MEIQVPYVGMIADIELLLLRITYTFGPLILHIPHAGATMHLKECVLYFCHSLMEKKI